MSENAQTFAPPRPGPPSGPPTGHRPLYRSRTDRKVAGVCGGVAAYFGIDPIILRILIVVLSLFGGSGLLIYAAGWLLLPDEGQPLSEIQKLLDRNGQARSSSVVVATLLIIGLVIGLGSLVGRHWWLGSGPDVWPLLVVGGIGVAIWYSRRTPQNPGTLPPPVPQPAYTQPAYTEPAAAGAWYPTAPLPVPPPKVKRRKSVLGALTLSSAVLAAGIMLPFNTTGVWHLHVVPFLAVLLIIIGIGLIVGAFIGRSRGLIAWGVLLTLVTAIAAAVPAIDVHGTGDMSWRPTSVSSVPVNGYRWAAGDTQLDLTGLPLTTPPTEVRGDLGAGTMVVTVPDNVRVVLDAHVGLGTIRFPDGSHSDGVGREVVRTLEPTSGPAVGTLNLRLDIGAGTLEVRRAQA